MTDWKVIIGLIGLALLLSFVVFIIAPPSSAADNLTVINATPTPTPVPTATPLPLETPNSNFTIPYYVQQGDTVYVGETVDVSGVMAGVLNLAYYGGYDEESGQQYLLNITGVGKKAYWRYYLDPAIFGSRLGKWYKWNGHYESNGNTLAFVVAYKRAKTNLSENLTLQNPNQTPLVLPKIPLLPDRHIADYLIARGNGFSIPVNGSTNVWIFGNREALYDYHSFNGSVDITPEAINTLSVGLYQVLIQTRANGSYGESPVRYNNLTGELEWFDTKTFTINHYRIIDQTPENVLAKLQTIFPSTNDKYQIFKLEVQDPSLSIDQIDATNSIPIGIEVNAVSLDNPSYMDVRGYTNVAKDTIVYIKVDPDFNVPEETMWRDSIITRTEGDKGNMRTYKAIVPVLLYNMAPGRHFIAAKTSLGNAYVTASFYIYDNPTGTYVQNKTIRYISGRYGPDELVPTPTPITVTQIVTQVVTRVVTVPVTPSNEQVYAQQKVASEKTWWEGVSLLAKVIGSGLFLLGGTWYGISLYRRLKE
jgi:hypothetical protein